jgi:hypothetical protein
MDQLPTTDPPTLASIQATLVAHDERSHKRFKKLKGEIDDLEANIGGSTMTDGTAGSSTQVHHMYSGGAGQSGSDPMSGAAHSAGLASLAAMASRNGLGGMGGAGGAGFGLGGAALGFIAGALINGGGGGGLFGGNGNRNSGVAGDLVTTAHLQSALNAQSQSQNTNNILQNLATIQQLIPEATGNIQNAIAQSQISLMNQGTQGQLQVAGSTLTLSNNVADARHNINDNIHAGVLSQLNGQAQITGEIVAARKDVNDNVHLGRSENSSNFATVQLQSANYNAATQLGVANLGLQAANNTSAILSAIRDDGDRTRVQAQAINDATLNRIIVEQANALIELRNDHRHDERARQSELIITQTVNQNQSQAQQQQQQQQQFLLLSNIAQQLAGITQIAHATNSNVIAGNTGAVATGPQTANPTNVNA